MTDSYLEAGGRVVGPLHGADPVRRARPAHRDTSRCFVAWPAIRRSQVLSVGGFDEQLRIAYDWDFWIRSLHAGARAGLVATTPLHRYRISQGSLSGARPAAIRERVTVLEKAAANPDVGETAPRARGLPALQAPPGVADRGGWAIRNGEPDARRRALAVAVARGPRFGVRTRLKAAIAALLRRGGRYRRMARREQEATARG